LGDGAASRGPRHRASPFEPVVDDAAIDADPVADRWEVARVRRFMTETAADLGPPVDVAGQAVQPPLFLDDARPLQVQEFLSADLIFEEIVPAKSLALRNEDAPFQERWKMLGM